MFYNFNIHCLLRMLTTDYNFVMIPYLEITTRCTKCNNCKLVCPENAILSLDGLLVIETWSCTLCNLCVEICPVDCIKFIEPSKMVETTS